MADKTLAEFIISMHEESKAPGEFAAKLKEVGGDQFGDSLISNLDRLISNMHPKYKKNKASSTNGKANGNGKPEAFISGLSLPDGHKWKSVEDLVAEEQKEKKLKNPMANQVDDLMSQLDNIGEKRKAVAASSSSRDYDDRDRGRDSKRSRRVSVSPPRARNGGSGRPQLDDRPVLYKIYNGRVTNMRDFGAFVQLEGVAGRQEGEYFSFNDYNLAEAATDTPISCRHGSHFANPARCSPQSSIRCSAEGRECQGQSHEHRWQSIRAVNEGRRPGHRTRS